MLKLSITIKQARILTQTQFPHWANLPITSVTSAGTANTLFRLGKSMVLRFPRSDSARKSLLKELHWLPKLQAYLSLALPTPLEVGESQEEYSGPWAIYSWLKGKDLWVQPEQDLCQLAVELAQFVKEFQAIEMPGPEPGSHNSYRGAPLLERDSVVQESLIQLKDKIDVKPLIDEWSRALEQPLWNQSYWIHGDLQPGNLLCQKGHLTAVIDFGLLGVGDPAVDLLPAWNLFDSRSRKVFKQALNPDEATWIRARGWALYQAVLALPYYWESNPVMVKMAKYMLSELFNEQD